MIWEDVCANMYAWPFLVSSTTLLNMFGCYKLEVGLISLLWGYFQIAMLCDIIHAGGFRNILFFCIHSCHPNLCILHFYNCSKSYIFLDFPFQNFQSILRCIKLWAKRRGVYGNVRAYVSLSFCVQGLLFAILGYLGFDYLWTFDPSILYLLQLFGYFGGVHLAILAAFVCQKNPHANLNVLMSSFFKTFSGWPWPTPVALEDGRLPTGGTRETRALMPIQLPCSPYGYCHSNITKSTFYRITTELTLGNALTRVLLFA